MVILGSEVRILPLAECALLHLTAISISIFFPINKFKSESTSDHQIILLFDA